MTEYFGGVFFINLEKRKDRRELIEKELELIGLSAERFNAIETEPGIIGCGYSHLSVLKEARARGLSNVLIFEDDFKLIVEKEVFWSNIRRFFESGIPYDVLMFSYSIEKSSPINDLVLKVEEATTASAYVVNSCFYDTLINLYEENLPLLESTGEHWIYANDQIWKTLQPIVNWFAFTTRLGIQRASFSDNTLVYTDRGV